jgi:WD40 repeat protein
MAQPPLPESPRTPPLRIEASGAGWSVEGVEGLAPPPPGHLPDPGPRYLREGLIGVGGMGRVYRAWDRRLSRPVALKVAAREGVAAARLAREAEVTAGLDHPGIVAVHDSGLTEEGLPFYAMRLIRGRALSEVLAERPALADRLDLLRHVLAAVEAVAAAHRASVVHRDLKPSNLMVGELGETQVVDWGLALRLREEAAPIGEVVGTPGYMSPEQERGDPVDRRSDVWSLGAILRELVAGAQGPTGEPLPEEALPAELLAVARKATLERPAARYPDASALAVDLAAWLDGRQVAAHSYTPRELARRLLGAWRAPLWVAAVALAVGAVLVALGTQRLATERDRALAAQAEADDALAEARVAEAQYAVERGALARAEELAIEALAHGESPGARGVLAGISVLARPTRRWSRPLDDCVDRRLLGPNDWVCARADGLARVVDGVDRWTHPDPAPLGEVRDDFLVISLPDGSHQALLLSSGALLGDQAFWWSWGFSVGGGRALLNRPATDPTRAANLDVGMPQHCPNQQIFGATGRLSRDGRRWAAVCADYSLRTGVPGAAPDRVVAIDIGAGGEPASTLISPDGQRYFIGTVKGALVRVDLLSGAVVTSPPMQTESLHLLGLSPDGARLALRGDRGELEVRDAHTLGPIARLPLAAVVDARFLPDGDLLIATREALSRWSLPARVTRTAARRKHGLTSALFSPDGATLATSHAGGEVNLWSLPDLERRQTVSLGAGVVKPLAFSPDGGALFATMLGPVQDPTVFTQVIDPQTGAVTGRLHPIGGYRLLPLLDDTVLSLWQFAGIQGRHRRSGAAVEVPGCSGHSFIDVGSAPDGRLGLLISAEGVVMRVASHPARCLGVLPGEHRAQAGDIDARGELLLLGVEDALLLTDAAGAVRWRQATAAPGPLDVALSPDGRWAAAAGRDGNATVYRVADGRLMAVLVGHGERVVGVDFSPDSERLATASWDGSARLWSMAALDLSVGELRTAAAVLAPR